MLKPTKNLLPHLISNRKWQFQLQLAEMHMKKCSTNQEKQQMRWSTRVTVCRGSAISGGSEIAHFY